MYRRGEYESALRGFHALADNGDVAAQYNLGVMYLNGQGTDFDEAEALRWFKKAAEQGDIRAQYNVAAMYINGTGVPRDYVRAYKWFNVLASQGVEGSQATAIRLAKVMSASQLQEANRLYREWTIKNKACMAPPCKSTRSEVGVHEPAQGMNLEIPPAPPVALAPATQTINEKQRIKHSQTTRKNTSLRPSAAPSGRTVNANNRTSERLAELEVLLQERLISQDEYKSIRQRILRGQ